MPYRAIPHPWYNTSMNTHQPTIVLPDGSPAHAQARPAQAAALAMVQAITRKEAPDFATELQAMLDFEKLQLQAETPLTTGQLTCIRAVQAVAAFQAQALSLLNSATESEQPSEDSPLTLVEG